MTSKQNNKEQIWMLILYLIPILLLSKLSDQFAESSLNKILFAGLFGAVGGIIGIGVYHLVKTKTILVKSVSVILLFGLCLTILVVVNKINRPTLQTCEVCGFIAVFPDKSECDYCGSLTWDKQYKLEPSISKKEWLKAEQLDWFSIDSLNQVIDFYESSPDQGFLKDNNWKPVISQEDLIDDYNYMN